MLRVLELALFLAPFAAYGLFLLTTRGAGPSVPALVATLAGLAVLGGGLVWFGVERGGEPEAVYEPAHLENGHVVDGRISPR